jgi:hypothetical protein
MVGMDCIRSTVDIDVFHVSVVRVCRVLDRKMGA